MSNEFSTRRQTFNALALGVLLALIGVSLTYAFTPLLKQREEGATDPLVLGEAPFHVSVREAYHEADDGARWVFPEKLPVEAFSFYHQQPGQPTPSLEQQHAVTSEAMTSLGGMRVGENCSPECVSVSRYRVTLTGNRKQPVHIDSMRAVVRGERPAPDGTLFNIPPEGGGPVDVVYLDLDSADKNAVTVDERGNPTRRHFTDVENRFAAEGEPLVFEVIGATNRPVLYEWELVLEVTQDGRQETMVVDLGSGEALRTIGWLAVPKYGARYSTDRGLNPKIIELK
ncbi:hypothetical protein [Micromonospora sp. WMMD1082]|uniref:hypothetical protein n=1 Tax=Micromonospora sp. WMMD1082 TaxID=3016104 RepID=UPI0024163FCB|nr:hypothetical protein [Micromonospora sp. WMMD1082]MDG4797198.1 hypothetical protein [Micromonospora sp. WMMD1082]